MFGRLLSYIKTMGTGSMRKRLYTRLAGGAALLVLTVFAIAQAQRMSASRQAAVVAQLEESQGNPEDESDADSPRLARSPQPVPQSADEVDSASSLKPPSTFSFAPGNPASLANAAPRYQLEYDDDSDDRYAQLPATDGYGSSSASQFSDVPQDPVSADNASPYGDRYAATGRYSISSGESGYGASSDDRYGSPRKPAATTFADVSDDEEYEEDRQYAEPSSPDHEVVVDGTPRLPPRVAAGPPTDSLYGYGESASGTSGGEGITSSRFADDERSLSPAAHLEDPDQADTGATTTLEDADVDELPTSGSGSAGLTQEERVRSSGRSSEPAPAVSYPDDGIDDANASDNDVNEREELAEVELDERSSAAPYSEPSAGSAGTGNSSYGSSAGGAAASGSLLNSSVPPRELPPAVSRSDVRGVPLGDSASGGLSSGFVADATSAVPGTRDLEGAQIPSVTIEKFAPPEVQVGQSADFEVLVSNVGRTPAHDVVVMDRVPQGTALNQTTPQAEQAGDTVIWRLGTLQPGSEIVLKMNVTPQTEGDLGSVAQVSFRAQATARTVSTRPEVVLDVRVADQVLIGDSLSLVIMVRNEGTGAARGVVIEEDVPEGFFHPSGRELENEIGILRPNETKTLELRLEAQRPGIFRNVVRVRDVGATDLTQEREIEIIAPKLEVDIQGPRLRYVERQATYELSIRNAGTASARRVELLTNLPRGMKFISANKLGQYDARQHAVYWSLDELPPGKEGTVSMVTLPTAAGEQVIQVEGTAELGTSDTAELAVRVENIAELSFTIADSADPIEVGSDTVYRIEVMNQGGKADTNVLLTATLPDELTPTSADGPTSGNVSGQQVQFDPVPRLSPGERIVFQVFARGRKAGDARVRIQMLSDEAPKPVVKEESTRVYTD
jgi:uncharacterized repeat protein (TIGR01451 family)